MLCWWSREANHRTWWHLGLSCLCTAGLLQSSSETLFNEIWNACWLYIDMWGNVWAKAAVTNPQVLSTAYKPNVGIPRFIGLTKKHDFMGLKSEKINHQWSSQFDCRAANLLRSAAPWDQPHTGCSWEGERKWDFDIWYIGIQGMVWDKWERGKKRIQWAQTAVEVLKLWLYLLDWGSSETMEDDSEFPSALVCLSALFLMTHTHWWTPVQQAVSYSKEGPCWVWPSHAFLTFILWIGGQSTKELEHCKLTWSQRICGFPDFICVPEVFQMAFCIQV